ncbi:hypothetical protein DFJ63DRAFT_311379 [Scheffersomyces coipomensis]|uniref:uncharacterized protein n=1 Tax=Scheffersomyces coipomensis TaxID=1788519 RepID=UPI00315C953C
MDDEELDDADFYSDEESFEFEFDDDENNEVDEGNGDDIEEDEEVTVQNKYYSAKNLKDDSPSAAIAALKDLIDNTEQTENTVDWIFKAHKQIIKINFQNRNYNESLEFLKRIIPLLGSVQKDYAEETLGTMINNYSTSKDSTFVSSLYTTILNSLQSSNAIGINSQRLWLKININRLNSYIDSGSHEECPALFQSINEKLKEVNESTRNAYSLEVIAAEIEYESRKSTPTLSILNNLYRRSLSITTAVTHPKILAIIKECGAKIQFHRGNYEKSRLDFYDCFKNYDVAGSSNKYRILKYVALCSLLTDSELNLFESQETRTYSQLKEYSNLLLLIKAYDSSDLNGFNKISEKMKVENDPILVDDIFNISFNQILLKLKLKLIINYVSVYHSIRFDFIQNKLNINQAELEELLLKLIVDGKLAEYRIDYVNNYIESVGERKKLFTLAVQANDIRANLKALNVVKFDYTLSDVNRNTSNVDQMEIDTNINQEVTKSKVDLSDDFFYSFDYTSKVHFKVIDAWYSYMYSAIPDIDKSEASLLSKFRSENKSISISKASTKDEDDIANTNTKAGILSSTFNSDAHGNEEDDDDSNESFNKSEMLAAWYNELQALYDQVVNR